MTAVRGDLGFSVRLVDGKRGNVLRPRFRGRRARRYSTGEFSGVRRWDRGVAGRGVAVAAKEKSYDGEHILLVRFMGLSPSWIAAGIHALGSLVNMVLGDQAAGTAVISSCLRRLRDFGRRRIGAGVS
jgi:hypothetical protein